MASSSVSQEDYEINGYELANRKSKIRQTRARNSQNKIQMDGVTQQHQSDNTQPLSAEIAGLSGLSIGDNVNERDPSPQPCGRVTANGGSNNKDKRFPPRTTNLNKGKNQRDRRKLREKRRSTGVVHLASTESTGGSTGDEDELSLNNFSCTETKKNTLFNEQHPLEQNHDCDALIHTRTKSPSDLDADEEDNEDYDSCAGGGINQSESSVSLPQHLHARIARTDDALFNLDKFVVVDNNLSGELNGCHDTLKNNGRPQTPCTNNLEELLERARDENSHLLQVIAEKDRKINIMEKELCKMRTDYKQLLNSNARAAPPSTQN